MKIDIGLYRLMGETDAPVLSYNFTLAGITDRLTTPDVRVGALVIGMDGVADDEPVRMAAHPDDPLIPTIRQQPRLVYQSRMYQRPLDLAPSPSNALELCVGTIAEMTEGDAHDAVDAYSRQGKVAQVHLRNAAGKVSHYQESFIDEGDVDMVRILDIRERNGFDGVIVPDHISQTSCAAPWHAGMAHTIGFMAAVLAIQKKRDVSSALETIH